MMQLADHLILLPVALPLLAGALLALINERRHHLKFAINAVSTVLLLLMALLMFRLCDQQFWPQGIGVYLAANWMAPFGITLLVDALTAIMLILTALLACMVLVFSWTRWSRVGVHFHSLFQFMLMGLNGAFLTADLFNLFVFFEVMLAASYGLVLHGYNATRIRAGLQYIAINLVSSFFFLIGIALVYAATGTLNMADIAERAGTLIGTNRLLLETGAAMLAITFLTKSAIWPLGFWLPGTYAAASPPVAAMLVLMTKSGIYVILRLWSLVFSDAIDFGSDLLFWSGIATLAFGAAGLLASQEPARMASYSAVISSGTLLALISYAQPQLTSSALYYFVSSTLAVAAFVLLIELIERIRTPGTSLLALTMEAFAIDDASPQESAGVAIPAAMAFIGLAFVGCALIIAGLPPLSGFVAKFNIFHELLNPAQHFTFRPGSWLLMVLLLLSGLAAIIALMRFGVRTFWAAENIPPRLPLSEIGPVYLLLLLCISMTFSAGLLRQQFDSSANALYQPQQYIERVLHTAAIAYPSQEQQP